MTVTPLPTTPYALRQRLFQIRAEYLQLDRLYDLENIPTARREILERGAAGNELPVETFTPLLKAHVKALLEARMAYIETLLEELNLRS